MGRLSPLLLALALLLSVSSFNVSAEDGDSDGDGWSDYHEESCGTDPLNWQDVPQDTDSSGICDYLDADDDNDGWWIISSKSVVQTHSWWTQCPMIWMETESATH